MKYHYTFYEKDALIGQCMIISNNRASADEYADSVATALMADSWTFDKEENAG